ncbi:MAG: hypothetical protein UT48_C0010G0006 [Parcubacteria group bacterium GW2011_GWE2_39_37]|uniref:Uncharacterized protein n=1 Tax=Candidatus Falkowbacteria bacterium GW2011_GWF2_39_8 TaxID=1618642 RepID=A0A0G0PT13_9BACT|nr:MAG: hypothetical protein UT48_C0010G0006 [Parcubacteria group bacterium GW2011_GWE2_39_37]KKR31058.1 MAG: hypothetical protein UT64_C0076G0002 [Candidatus Falkowbacteria bacterium GW2011_GWF2_39_8]
MLVTLKENRVTILGGKNNNTHIDYRYKEKKGIKGWFQKGRWFRTVHREGNFEGTVEVALEEVESVKRLIGLFYDGNPPEHILDL